MDPLKKNRTKQKTRFKNGILFFTQEAERSFFFIMTLIMLAAGAVHIWL